MPPEPPRPYPWRELLHPGIEALHLLSILGCLFLALVYWRVLPAPAWFGMQGYPPADPGWMINVWLAFAVLEYPIYFWGANLRVTQREPEKSLPEAQRRRAALLLRLSGAIGALCFALISYCILLGIVQGGGHHTPFDWHQRWPAAGSGTLQGG